MVRYYFFIKLFLICLFAVAFFTGCKCSGDLVSMIEDTGGKLKSCKNSAQCNKDELCIYKSCLKKSEHTSMLQNSVGSKNNEMIIPEILWKYTTDGELFSSPALGDIEGDGKLEVVIGSMDKKIYAINGEDGSLLWTYKTGGAVYSSPALGDVDNDGKLEIVIGSNDGKIYAINGEDGSLLWTYKTGGAVYSSPALGDIDNDGKLEIVIGSNDGKIYTINGEDGSLLWLYRTAFYVYSSPALGDIDGDGKLEVVVGSMDKKIYAINGEDGSLLWVYRTGRFISSSPSLGDIDGDGRLDVVIGSYDVTKYRIGDDGMIYAINGEDGSLLWSYRTAYYVYSSPSLGDIDGDGRLEVIVGSYDNKIYAINGEDGNLLWTYKTGYYLYSSPSLGDVDGDDKLDIVIGSWDNKVYAVMGKNKNLIWSYKTESRITSSPSLGDIDGDGRLEIVFGSYDKKIYAIKTLSPVFSPSLIPWPEYGNRSYNRTRNLDSWEINDSIDHPSHIVDLIRNDAISGYIWKPGDIDYYSFNVPHTPSNISIRLDDIPDGKNYDLFLYDPSKTLIASSKNSGNIAEIITYSAKISGTYYIKVESSSGYSAVKPYSLYIDLQ